MDLDLTEYGEAREKHLDQDQAAALLATGLVEVVPTVRRGVWSVAPAGKVGAVTIGDLTVRVRPKVAIDRIVFMLGYSLRGLTWLGERVDVEADDDIEYVLAEVFAHAVSDALRPGMLQGYRVVEEALPVVRGRIRIDDQIKRRPGLMLPIEITYDDFTIDIAENQILSAALRVLCRHAAVRKDLQRRLAGLEQQFADVTRLTRGMPLPHWRATRLNQRYVPALRLAEVILEGSSFEHRAGELRIDGFVLTMWKVFEDFVTAALTDAFQEIAAGSRVKPQRDTPLDEDGVIGMNPDIVWLDEADRVLAVLDAKYKAERYSGFPNSDVYQALAYAVALGVPDAHLIYAKGNEPVRTYQVLNSAVRVHAHVLDLSVPPSALLAQVGRLAMRIQQGAQVGFEVAG